MSATITICVVALVFATAPSSGVKPVGEDAPFHPLDLVNPIDVLPPVADDLADVESSRAVLREERKAPITLFDDERDLLRQEERGQNQGGPFSRRTDRGRRVEDALKGVRERDRRRNLEVSVAKRRIVNQNSLPNQERELDRLTHSTGQVRDPLTPVQKRWRPALAVAKEEVEMQKKIKRERDGEIRREIRKSMELREKILREKKNSGKSQFSLRRGESLPSKFQVVPSRRNEVTLDRDTRHRRERDRVNHELIRSKRNRERDLLSTRESENPAVRRESDRLSHRLGEPDRRDEISGKIIRGLGLGIGDSALPPDRFQSQRPQFIYRTRDGDNADTGRRHQNDRNNKPKAPILILEKVSVPVAVSSDNLPSSDGVSFPLQSPISPLYDERGASRPEKDGYRLYDERVANRRPNDYLYMDRRPGRPQTYASDSRFYDGPSPQETILPSAPFGFQTAPGERPTHFGNLVPSILIPPNAEAEVALANHAAQASEINRLNQAATLSGIFRLQQDKLAQAFQQQEIDDARTKILAAHVANNQAHALANHAAVVQAHAIANQQASAEAHALANQAVKSQAIADHIAQAQSAESLKHQLGLKTRYFDHPSAPQDQVASAQEIDLINLAIKKGIKDALKTQLAAHLDKVHEENFIRNLQATKEDLLLRLTLLKPYFHTNHEGYLLPDFLPLLPPRVPMSTIDLSGLQKIPLTPSMLITPGFKLPREILLETTNLDIRFVEYILRLPEPIFDQILHLPKREFLLALFPKLFRDAYGELPSAHPLRHPNRPRDELHSGEKVYHKHYHIHSDVPSSSTHYSVRNAHPDLRVAQSHHKLHHDASRPPSSYPSSQHRLEGNSYISYNPKPFGQHEEKGYFNSSLVRTTTNPRPHHAELTAIHFVTTSVPPKPSMITRGIQVRPKGYGIHHYSTTPGSIIKLTNQYLPTTRSPTTYHSSHLPDFAPREQYYEHPVQKHTITKTISHSVSKDYTPVPQTVTIRNEHIFNAAFINQQSSAGGQHLPPLRDSGNYSDHNPNFLSESSVESFKSPAEHLIAYEVQNITPVISFVETVTPSYFDSTRFSNLHPVQIFNSPTIHSSDIPNTQFSYTSNVQEDYSTTTFQPTPFDTRPFSTDIFGINFQDTSDEVDFEEVSTTTDTESPLFMTTENPTLLSTISEDGSSDYLELDDLNPPRGFSGNVRQKTIFEKLAERDERWKDLPRLPGTDSNDDDHVISIFRKKKGNFTDFEIQNGQENFTSKEKKPENTRKLSADEKWRLRVSNLVGGDTNQQRSSSEKVIDKVKEIRETVARRPQETPTIVKFAELDPLNDRGQFFPSSVHRATDSLSTGVALPPAKDSAPLEKGENRSPKRLDSGVVTPLKEAKWFPHPPLGLNFVTTTKKPPQPQRVQNTPTPFFPSASRIYHGFPFPGEIRRTNEPHSLKIINNNGSRVTDELISIPRYLKKEPQCSVAGGTRRSFCLYPEGYPHKEADKLISQNNNGIKENMKIIRGLPEPKLDLQAAYKQIPNLNVSVFCEPEIRNVQLSWSRDVLGSWFAVLQSKSFPQAINVTTCSATARIKGCFPLLQPRPLLVFHPEDQNGSTIILDFPLPVGCVYVSKI